MKNKTEPRKKHAGGRPVTRIGAKIVSVYLDKGARADIDALRLRYSTGPSGAVVLALRIAVAASQQRP